MSKTNLKKSAGFTLLEILLVVGIISILAGIVILAINPTKQLGDTRNAQRRSDVMTILNSIHEYGIDNSGVLSDIMTGDTAIASSTDCETDGDDAIDLEGKLVDTYLIAIPTDPTPADDTVNSEYKVSRNGTTGRITVCAPNSVGEGSIIDPEDMIEVTR